MKSLHQAAEIPPEQDGRRLDQALAEMFPAYSRSRLKQWILDGRVSLDGESAIPKTPVRSGQRVQLNPAVERTGQPHPQPIDLSVLHEDDHLMVVDKPAGMVVHPGAGNADGTLQNGLLHRLSELAALPRAGLLHRLDKDTSGAILVAKTLTAHTQLVRDLEARQIVREYRAACVGRLIAGGSVDLPVGRHPTQRTRMAVVERGRPAVTHYRVLARFKQHSYLAVRLETGRTHQIRVHMAHLQHPLIGDLLYGGRLKVPAGAAPNLDRMLHSFRHQALHACRLSFRHPVTGQRLVIEAPLPRDLLDLLRALAGPASPSVPFEEMSWPDPIADSS